MTDIACFLPCRRGSERVPNKNTRKFAGLDGGLISIKLNQLINCSKIDEIYLSTDDELIIERAESIKSPKLIIHKRDSNLALSSTSTDELINHAGRIVESKHILWTHVTSPFVSTSLYDRIIDSYLENTQNGYDSLVTTNLVRGFLWRDNAPFNYDRSIEKWPRTQTIPPLHEINSAVFLAPKETYEKKSDRIGDHPYLYPLDKILGHDIDWEEDFLIAEAMLKAGIVHV